MGVTIHSIWFPAVGSLHVKVRFWKMGFCSIFPPWRVHILGGLQSKKVVSKIGLIKIVHLNKFFSLYFTLIWMVSNKGIESKLRPLVYMEVCGFGQIKPFYYLIPNFDMCFYIVSTKGTHKNWPNFDSFLVLWQGWWKIPLCFSV